MKTNFYGKDHQIPLIGGTFYKPNLQNIYQYEPDLVIGIGGVHDTLRDGSPSSSGLHMDLLICGFHFSSIFLMHRQNFGGCFRLSIKRLYQEDVVCLFVKRHG